MNGKWALSAKDEGTLGLSDALCPARHNQGPLLFFEVRSLVFFLANFCRYWLWDLQAPIARGCIWSRSHRQERGSPCKSQGCQWPGVFLAPVCLALNVATARRLSSAWVFLSGQFVIHGVAVRHGRVAICAARCAASAEPDWCEAQLTKENERESPSAMVIARGLSNSRKFSVLIKAALCHCSFHTCPLTHFSSIPSLTSVIY